MIDGEHSADNVEVPKYAHMVGRGNSAEIVVDPPSAIMVPESMCVGSVEVLESANTIM
jgi:hypothetical protein